MPTEHRRHRLILDLETDTISDLVRSLRYLAHEIEHDGRPTRRIIHRGPAATWRALLRTRAEQPRRTDTPP